MKTKAIDHPAIATPVGPRRWRRSVQLNTPEDSRTKQSFKDECDINNILESYNRTGRLPDLIKENPQFGDFSDPLTYQDALNTVLMAETQFNALDSDIRERFSNDPIKFLDFTSDPKNLPEMVTLGLATQRTTNQTTNDQSSDLKPTHSKKPKATDANDQES